MLVASSRAVEAHVPATTVNAIASLLDKPTPEKGPSVQDVPAVHA
jgi:hypothetical protein